MTKGGRPPVDLMTQLLVTLWILGNPECLRSVADRFDICKATAFRVYRRVCKAIVQHLVAVFVTNWTESSRRTAKVWLKRGFPGVLGPIDGCHIPIKAPRINHEQYVNRKGFHSVTLECWFHVCRCVADIPDQFMMLKFWKTRHLTYREVAGLTR